MSLIILVRIFIPMMVHCHRLLLGDERREYVIVKNAGGDTLRIRDIVIVLKF